MRPGTLWLPRSRGSAASRSPDRRAAGVNRASPSSARPERRARRVTPAHRDPWALLGPSDQRVTTETMARTAALAPTARPVCQGTRVQTAPQVPPDRPGQQVPRVNLALQGRRESLGRTARTARHVRTATASRHLRTTPTPWCAARTGHLIHRPILTRPWRQAWTPADVCTSDRVRRPVTTPRTPV